MSQGSRQLAFGFAVSHFNCKCVLVAAGCLIASWSRPARAQEAIVRPHEVHQHISGFGASSAWTAQTVAESDADLLFSVDKGAGLSLLRVRISPEGTTWELNTAKQAQARGAAVWATPWSPPAAYKSNNDVNYGGTLLPEHADEWATTLAAFVTSTAASGVSLFALSAQNEPSTGSVDGAPCTAAPGKSCIAYEACRYTSASLGDFVANHLKPALSAAGASVNVMGPETQGWNDFSTYWGSFNQASDGDVQIVATHEYNGSPASYPDITASGRELWQTEVYDRTPGVDPGIESALRVAMEVQNGLVNGNLSAWLYWWITPGSDDNGGLFAHGSGLPTKRLFALGNFSRFLRPGYYRIELDLPPTPSFQLSAFVDTAQASGSRKLVLVAVNQGELAISEKLRFDGYSTGSWQATVTSDALSLEPGPAIADNGGGDFDYSFPPKSITTLVGVTTGAGPSIARSRPDDTLPPEAGGCACSAAGTGSTPAGALCLAVAAFALAAARRRV
jgi:glucuronoarabinoxylan endo-1,4-beta-xylanase